MITFKKIRWRNFLSTGNVFTEIDLTKNKIITNAYELGSVIKIFSAQGFFINHYFQEKKVLPTYCHNLFRFHQFFQF